MTPRYSIATARTNLPRLVDEAESGADVVLTRHGRPVAVVVSTLRYEALRGQSASFRTAFKAFVERQPRDAVGIDPAFFDRLRDRRAGRAVRI